MVGGVLLACALLPGALQPPFAALLLLWALNGAGQAMVAVVSVGLLAQHTKKGRSRSRLRSTLCIHAYLPAGDVSGGRISWAHRWYSAHVHDRWRRGGECDAHRSADWSRRPHGIAHWLAGENGCGRTGITANKHSLRLEHLVSREHGLLIARLTVN